MKLVNMKTGKVIEEVLANKSLTIDEALYLMGIDVDNQESLEKYSNKYDFIYKDDEGEWAVDYDIIDTEE